LKDDPKNIPVIVGLATCLFEMGDVDKAHTLLDDASVDNKEDPRIKAVLARIKLGEQVKKLADPVVLEKRVEKNPDNHQARFDLAIVYNAQGKHAAAADTLLTIIEADRNWKDGDACKQLLQFFDIWGPKNKVTCSARRKLSALLFS